MRIGQAMRAGSGSPAGRASGSGQGGGFRLGSAPEAQPPVPARGPATVTSLEAILALQSVDEGGERRKRAAKQGNDILDLLDELRIAVLSGHLPAGGAARLRNLLQQWESHDDDPALAEILKQIDLRAQVEMAKLDKTPG